MKNILISELPEPYRSLARLREKKFHERNQDDRPLILGFDWTETPEGRVFWFAVDCGELPQIPEASLKEIDMKIEEIAAMPGSYTMPGFTPGKLYAFWDGDDPQEWTVARYSHSERTTPFDRHWTEGRKYFAHMGRLGAWRKGCPAHIEILAPEEGA